MIIKYIGFLFTLLWSYTFIKSQSIFKKGSGILITLFVSNISWLTFIAACFYGFKNFSFYQTLLGIVVSIVLVHFPPNDLVQSLASTNFLFVKVIKKIHKHKAQGRLASLYIQ